jgi:hypothetical protein
LCDSSPSLFQLPDHDIIVPERQIFKAGRRSFLNPVEYMHNLRSSRQKRRVVGGAANEIQMSKSKPPGSKAVSLEAFESLPDKKDGLIMAEGGVLKPHVLFPGVLPVVEEAGGLFDGRNL